jgi:ketosteroid isomerase-like protein
MISHNHRQPNPRQTQTMTTQTDEITNFLSDRAAAELQGDTAFLDSHLTDDFVGVGPLGFMLSKQDWLARHETVDLTYDAFQLDEIQTRVYGDAAVVSVHQKAAATYQGHPVPGHARATLVLVHLSGAWQLAGVHMSFIAGTPGAPLLPGRP